MTALSDLLHASLPEGWRPVDVAKALEGRIHRATVYHYFNGQHPKVPDERVLQALADVIPNADIRKLRKAAEVAAGTTMPWRPPKEAARLSEGQQRALDAFIAETVRATDAAIRAMMDEARATEDERFSIGAAIRAERERRNLDVRVVARYLGVGPKILERWENGAPIPPSKLPIVDAFLAGGGPSDPDGPGRSDAPRAVGE